MVNANHVMITHTNLTALMLSPELQLELKIALKCVSIAYRKEKKLQAKHTQEFILKTQINFRISYNEIMIIK